MSDSVESKSANDDMEGVLPALLRAARRAREVARQTNTAIVIVEDGVIIEERVTEVDAEMAPVVARSLAHQ